MAFDACMMRAVLREFSESFPEAKIEKVFQPLNDEIDFVIHGAGKRGRLIFNVGPGVPRIQLSDIAKENPEQAPMFCMFLRKRLTGAKIVSVTQTDFDRIARFSILGYDEMGFRVSMTAVCEIMGKYANFILLDAEDKIISALKMIDFAASSVRQILPGLKYTPPAQPDKLSPVEIERDVFFDRLDKAAPECQTLKFITSLFSGVAVQVARELTYRATGRTDTEIKNTDKNRLWAEIESWRELLREHRYKPTIAYSEDGTLRDFSYMDISYFENSAKTVSYDSTRELLDKYFREKDRQEKIQRRAHDVKTALTNAISRIERKLDIQRATLKDSERGEDYRRIGDLITSNMHIIKQGMTKISVVDYYDESCPTVEITLDRALSPSANAQKMYKLYNKCKNARVVLTEQIEKWESELAYLDSVKTFLDNAETEADIAEIRNELYTFGYGRAMKGYRPKKPTTVKPLTMKTTGGFTLFVGRNNIENDKITFKCAERDDIWFHVKDMPGSHVVLVTDGKEPGDIDYTEAAAVAAGYSKASSDMVAVDYTRVKNIKKPQGAKPGFVIYKTNYTAFVKPKKRPGEEII